VLDNLTSNLSSDLLTPSGSVAGTLVNRGSLGNASPLFWSIVGNTNASKGFDTDSSVGALVNSTPIRFIRYGENSDSCDVANNTYYYFSNSTPENGSCQYNIPAFKAWCYSLSPHCQSILTLPGEVWNASYIDRYEANYIVNTLGFQPTYWAIGNEPEDWEHYNISWKNWKANDSSPVSALNYAIVLNKSITSVRSVPGLSAAKFVGIEAAASTSTSFFQEVATVAGKWIAAIAYHSYPDSGGSPDSLAEYYEPLTSATHNISGSYGAVRSAISGKCLNCSTMPIQLGEYNGGPSVGGTSYDSNFSGAVFTAASVAQAIDAQVPTMTYFELQSMGSTFGFAMDNKANQIDPAGSLYQSMFPYLNGKTAQNVAVRTTLTSVWAAMLTTSGEDAALPVTHETFTSLLVVNANLTSSLSLSLNGVISSSMSGRIISWNNSTSSPVSRWGSFGVSFTVPSQGILLLNGSLCYNCITAHLGSGSKPGAFAVSWANNMTYVADSGAHLVQAISRYGGQTNVSVPTCGTPSQLAYSPVTTYVFVTCASSNSVVEISPVNTVVKTIPVGSAPGAIAYDPANGDMLVANYGSNNVSVIIAGTDARSISVGSGPSSLTYDSTNSYVYVTNSQSASITVMNSTLVKLGSNPSTPTNPIATVVDTAGDAIVICNSSSEIRVFSGTAATHTISLPSGSHPSAAAMAAGQVVITEYSSNGAAILNVTNWTAFATISTPAGPNSLAWDSTDGKLYITCFLAGSVFELYGLAGFADVATGSQPVAVAWNPHYDVVSVAAYGSGAVWWAGPLNPT
jgi:YVTN family beta-propeller protein